MRAAIITVAGISSRFNEGIPEEQKILKAIYNEHNPQDTLLVHLIEKCAFADRIIIVGGYMFDQLQSFVSVNLQKSFPQLVLVRNDHYADLASGYSLYLGINKALDLGADELLFVEGDLDIDDESFKKIVDAEHTVLTYTTEPIYANKAVVLYKNEEDRFQYAFNSVHGLLRIDNAFSCILNSGQAWKFDNMEALEKANELFFRLKKDGTNLWIIQQYIDNVPSDTISLVKLERWTNCNTREDYNKILEGWRKK